MYRPSKSFLFSALAVVGWVLLALAVSGVTNAVVIKASTINAATNETTPTLDNLINCPYQASGGVIANDAAADFVLVDCSDTGGAMIALSDCNSALTAVSGVTVDAEAETNATAMPVLPYSVSDANPTTAGTIAVYAVQIEFSVATGVAFQVNLQENSTSDNADAIKAVIQGLRGLVTLTGTSSSLPVAIFAVDSNTTDNPCTSGNDLSGINVSAQYDTSPNTVRYLILNVEVSDITDLCDVETTNAFGTSSVDSNFTNGTGSCDSENFSVNNPQTYYPVFFADAIDNTNNPTDLLTGVADASDLNFYPNLDANGSAATTTDLASAVACVNSTDSGSSQFGSVNSLVVRCENLHEAEDLETHYKDCQTALYGVRALIGADTRLLISVRLSTDPGEGDLAPNVQGVLAAATLYDTAVTGVVVRLAINENASSAAEVQANFAGITAIATAFSSYNALTPSAPAFNLILQTNPLYCETNGPLAPQGSGSSQTSVYTSCNVEGVNCLLGTGHAALNTTFSATCGFPANTTLGWEAVRGVVTAPNSGNETNATACNATSVLPAYGPATLASSANLSGSAGLAFPSVGGGITSEAAGTEAIVQCIFSSDGAGAQYGIVECDSTSDNFTGDCNDGFDSVRNVNDSAPIVVAFSANASSDGFSGLATTVGGDILNARGWGGAYMSLTFSENATAGDNLGNVTSFVSTMVGATNLSEGSNLTIGFDFGSAAVCLSGGALYSSDTNMTLYSRLTSAVSEGVSYVLFFEGTPNTTTTELCGFNATRVGYEVFADRTFGETCSNVTSGYVLGVLPSAVAPSNPGGSPGSAVGVQTSLGALLGLVALLVSLAL